MSKKVLIVGMHRSGTSAVAGWLHIHGISMGENLLASHKSNAKGHFEDLELIEFHRSVANDLGIHDWKDCQGNYTWNSEHIDKAKGLIQKRDLSNQQWGWKDPRLCIYLPNWLNVMDNVTIIVVYRDGTAVANSLQKREIANYLSRYNITPSNRQMKFWQSLLFFRYKKYHNLWKAYNKKILSDLSSVPDVIYLSQNRLVESLKGLYEILSDRGFELKEENRDFVDVRLFTNVSTPTKKSGIIFRQLEERNSFI